MGTGENRKTRHFWRANCTLQNTSGAFALFVRILAGAGRRPLPLLFVFPLLIRAVPVLLLLLGLILPALMPCACVLLVCHYSTLVLLPQSKCAPKMRLLRKKKAFGFFPVRG
jgi:hypothetical protein